jgi:hypothetical protein
MIESFELNISRKTLNWPINTLPNWLILFSKLLHLLAVLDLVYKNLGGLEAGDVMLLDNDGCIAGNIAGDFFLSLFIDETSKTSYINVLAASHGGFDDAKKSFYRSGNIGFVNAGFVSNLVDNVCFGHGDFVLRI